MQTLESLKSQGQATFEKLMGTVNEQPDEVKVWGVTAGSAVVGAVAVNAAARGIVAILATLASTPVALTVGAAAGGYLGWTYIRNWQAGLDEIGARDEPIAEEIVVTVVETGLLPEAAPVVESSAEDAVVIVPSVDKPEVSLSTPVSESVDEMSEVTPAANAPLVPDDLEVINGIGPVYAGHLQRAGIQSFAQLAELSPAQIRQIIGTVRAGHMIEPEKWIAEALMLAAAAR